MLTMKRCSVEVKCMCVSHLNLYNKCWVDCAKISHIYIYTYIRLALSADLTLVQVVSDCHSSHIDWGVGYFRKFSEP